MTIEHCEPGVRYGRAQFGNMAHIARHGVRPRTVRYVAVSLCGVQLIQLFDPHHEPVCFKCMRTRRLEREGSLTSS